MVWISYVVLQIFTIKWVLQDEYSNIIMYKEEEMIKLGQYDAVGGCC